MRGLLAAVILGGVFGSASATVESVTGDGMMVEIEVEVSGAPETVVAHMSFEDERFTLPLLDRGDSVFGLRTELERKNYMVVFEVVDEDAASSEPVSLQEMGADLSLTSGETTTTTESEEGLSQESQRLLWLAIALGAASLSLLAFWVLGDRGEDDEPVRQDDEDDTEEE
ncbi:MAG: hypothetical protein ACLFVZ_10915 [Actinomycetota bacterium]